MRFTVAIAKKLLILPVPSIPTLFIIQSAKPMTNDKGETIMKVSEFKQKVSGAPPLPQQLPDDYSIEQYLVDLFKHGAFIQMGQPERDRQFQFSINANGEVRASLTVPVSVNL
jgi:hypothetical protein